MNIKYIAYLLDLLVSLQSSSVDGPSDGDGSDSAGHDPPTDGLLCSHDTPGSRGTIVEVSLVVSGHIVMR
jgi:hypothetical protein